MVRLSASAAPRRERRPLAECVRTIFPPCRPADQSRALVPRCSRGARRTYSKLDGGNAGRVRAGKERLIVWSRDLALATPAHERSLASAIRAPALRPLA